MGEMKVEIPGRTSVLIQVDWGRLVIARSANRAAGVALPDATAHSKGMFCFIEDRLTREVGRPRRIRQRL
jgi:hypothetical protein